MRASRGKKIKLHRIVHDPRRSEGEMMKLCGWKTRATFDFFCGFCPKGDRLSSPKITYEQITCAQRAKAYRVEDEVHF